MPSRVIIDLRDEAVRAWREKNAMSAPAGSGSSWFEERDRQGLLDFWRVYDARYDDVSRSMAQAFSADAKLARIFDGPGVANVRKQTRELVRRSIGCGDWSPY